MNLPERDKHGYSIKYLKARMAVCFGGRVAEELIFGKDNISTGAGGGSGSDINQATQLARAMVTKYGMSEEMGPIEYGENQEEVFLGRSVTQTQSVSEEVAQKIDKEIRKLVDEGYNQATKILTEKIDDLHKIAKALITYETLTGEEIENIINKNLYPKDKVVEKPEENDDQSSALGAMGFETKNSSLTKQMRRYYTRVCNFYYGNESRLLVNSNKSIPLNGNRNISFDHIEIISRTSKKKISINKINRPHKITKKD
jgi:cell division protease FtsH